MVNVVVLSFAKPDSTYTTGGSLSAAGLDFELSSADLKAKIASLKSKNPSTQVLIAVGGATYSNWSALNTQALSALVEDLGLDGVDIDYEPTNPNCVTNNGTVSCDTDAEFIGLVRAIRGALPKAVVSLAGFSVGAYGESTFANAKPISPHTGQSVNMLKQVGTMLDMINIMAYDAGDVASTGFDWSESLKAYQSYFTGDVVLGVEAGNQAWGGEVTSAADAGQRAAYVRQHGGAGTMIWALNKVVDAGQDSAQTMTQAMCQELGLNGSTNSCQATFPWAAVGRSRSYSKYWPAATVGRLSDDCPGCD
jgi:chitinase